MISLVGYTGFVGSNLYAKGYFDCVYNSKNISQAYSTKPDLLIYAGLRAEKYLANANPDADMQKILEAQENITKIAPKKLVLISTIDVFKNPYGADENTPIDTSDLHPYGYNRYQLELWVHDNYPDALIIRLPGLFGLNIKKNFIYDYMNVIPFMLNEQKMDELSSVFPELKFYYQLQSNGFYKVTELEERDKEMLKNKFKEIGFSALNFTDSRSVYQMYNLGRLWNDIQIALKNNITLWHPATEPVSAAEIYHYLTGNNFINHLANKPANYDYRTIYSSLFGGKNQYISSKEIVLKEIKEFVLDYERKIN